MKKGKYTYILFYIGYTALTKRVYLLKWKKLNVKLTSFAVF